MSPTEFGELPDYQRKYLEAAFDEFQKRRQDNLPDQMS